MNYPDWAPQSLCELHWKYTSDVRHEQSDGQVESLPHGARQESVQLLERLIANPGMRGVWEQVGQGARRDGGDPCVRIFRSLCFISQAASGQFEPGGEFRSAGEREAQLEGMKKTAKRLLKQIENYGIPLPNASQLANYVADEFDPEGVPSPQLSVVLKGLLSYADSLHLSNRYLPRPKSKNAKQIYFVRRLSEVIEELIGSAPASMVATLTHVTMNQPTTKKEVEDALRGF